MFDDNKIDEMMKSILESGQEEVPAHIWEGVSAGLDKAARRKAVVIWFRRAAIGAASAAAAITLGILFSNPSEENITSSATGILASAEDIAVVETPQQQEILAAQALTAQALTAQAITSQVLTAQALTAAEDPAPTNLAPTTAAQAVRVMEAMEAEAEPVQQAAEIVPAGAEVVQEAVVQEVVVQEAAVVQARAKEAPATVQVAHTAEQSGPHESNYYVWEEEEELRKPVKASLVLSGLTGTNSAQTKGRANIMKRPSLVAKPIETGITETSTNTIYGIPVSVGAGAKIHFNDRWALGIGVNYTYLSSKFYGTYTLAKDGVEVSSTASDIKNSQHFVGIPINAYYNILGSKNINLYAYAGGTVEKCVADKYEVLSTNIIHTENPEGMQLSANAGIGVEFLIGKHLSLYADPSLRYYFDNNQPKSIRTVQPLTFGFELGLRVQL